MSDVRLYMLQSGLQLCKMRDIKMNQGGEASCEVPVPWFFLVHSRGNIVIDGGLAVEGLADPLAYWGAAVESYQPVMRPDQGCLAQITALGLAPDAVRFVVLSHLHFDHTGAVGRFPAATHVVQRREYDYAFTPDWFAAGAYTRKDFDRPGLKWQFLYGDATDPYDVYGDGVIRLVFTPGHLPGHQSFVVTLPNSGAILLTADAAYTLDHWNETALPGLMASAVDTVRSVQKLRALSERTFAMVVTGHDANAWPRFKQAPAYYD